MPYDVRMPDGTVIRNVPDGTKKSDLERRYQNHVNAGKPTSFWQGVAEGVQKVAHNGQDLLDAVNPAQYVLNPLAKAIGLDPQRATNAIRSREQQQINASPYRGSTAGRATGEIAATLPVGMLPGGPVVQGAAGGVLTSDNVRNPSQVATDALAGAVGGKLGDVAGRRIVAPVLERLGRTKAGQATADLAISALNKLPLVNAKALPRPQFSTAEQVITKAKPALDQVQANMQDAARLNLPYALADASPELRTLAGSVARKSADARALAEQTFGPRALGQADRALEAIDTHLAPRVNIEQRSAQIRQAARDAADPYYTNAMAKPAPSDPQLDAILQTPAGQEALRRAQTIAANEGMTTDGPATFETLNYAKRGLDSVLNDNRNPITGKLDLEGDPLAASTNSVLQRFKGRLDELNPDYAQARQVYQEGIAPRSALQLGYNELPKPGTLPRQFDAALQNVDPANLPEVQAGFATALGDKVGNINETANPYLRIYGSPNQQQKIETLFPQGAQDFGRHVGLESDMSKTAYETLGGSPTQARNMADQMFDANVGDLGRTVATSVANPKWAAAQELMRRMQAAATLRGQKKAEELAPVLYNTDPKAGLAFLQEYLRKQAEQQARTAAYQKAGSLLGLPAALGATALAQP